MGTLQYPQLFQLWISILHTNSMLLKEVLNTVLDPALLEAVGLALHDGPGHLLHTLHRYHAGHTCALSLAIAEAVNCC
jgi:hypothetical protein